MITIKRRVKGIYSATTHPIIGHATEKDRKKKRKSEEKKKKKRRKKEEKTNYFAIFYDLFLLAAPAAGCMGGEP